MNNKFRIRQARKEDKPQVTELYIRSIANKKNIFSPALVVPAYVKDYVNKTIDQGDMIVVENMNNELELIGEVHYYYNRPTEENDGFSREITFFSKLERNWEETGIDLVDWLYGEIEKKHKDVFSVEITIPVANKESVDSYKKKGILVESNYKGRLSGTDNNYNTLLPLAWINPSFN